MTPYLLESALVADCRRAAEAMGVVLEVAGQLKAKGSGSDRGLPDGFLSAGGKLIPVEFKRPATDDGTRAGRFSLDQLAAAERRRACGVETYAPSSLQEFVRLVNWARWDGEGAAPDCATVPPL